MVANGMAPKAVGHHFGIHHSYVSEWYTRYRLYGVEGLNKQAYKHYNFEERCEIVSKCQKRDVSLHEFCARHRVSQSVLKQWCHIVDVHGYESLRNIKKRGRPPKNKDMGRPKKREPQTELEKLQRELEYLRAENAYLKKLRALVLEKEAQKRKNEL